MCAGFRGTSHVFGKSIVGISAFWASTKLIPTIFLCESLRKKRIPWNRQVSPAQRRVHETQRGNRSFLYRLDMHRANCSSGCNASSMLFWLTVDVNICMRAELMISTWYISKNWLLTIISFLFALLSWQRGIWHSRHQLCYHKSDQCLILRHLTGWREHTVLGCNMGRLASLFGVITTLGRSYGV